MCRNKLYNNSLQTVTFPAFKDIAYIWSFGILNITSDIIAGGEAVSNTSMHIAIRNIAGSTADFFYMGLLPSFGILEIKRYLTPTVIAFITQVAVPLITTCRLTGRCISGTELHNNI